MTDMQYFKLNILIREGLLLHGGKWPTHKDVCHLQNQNNIARVCPFQNQKIIL